MSIFVCIEDAAQCAKRCKYPACRTDGGGRAVERLNAPSDDVVAIIRCANILERIAAALETIAKALPASQGEPR